MQQQRINGHIHVHIYPILYPRSLLVNVGVEPLIVAPLVGFGQLEKVSKSAADFMLQGRGQKTEVDQSRRKKRDGGLGPGRI